MKLRDSQEFPKGTVVSLEHQSEALAGNPWGDPRDRQVSVYLPHDYSDSGQPLPALWDLAAYTNSGPGHLNWRNHGENLVQRLDRLIGSEAMPPVAVVIPDCYTSLAGNQYVNSASVGRYADYLVEELVPFVSGRFNVVDSRDGRAVFGKSSGGYGALTLAMRYPETWGAAANMAGDVGFDRVYLPDFPLVARVLYDSACSPTDFVRAFWRKNRPGGQDFTTMMIIAMAASYDPDETQPDVIRLPFDIRTGMLHEDRWRHWLAHDPLNLIESHQEALRGLHGLYIDVGRYDQYNIQLGCRQMEDRLKELDIGFYYEEFDGTHSSTDWRLDSALPYLVEALKNAN